MIYAAAQNLQSLRRRVYFFHPGHLQMNVAQADCSRHTACRARRRRTDFQTASDHGSGQRIVER
jgi:hypothetical protein